MHIEDDQLSDWEAPNVDAVGKVRTRGDLLDPAGTIDGCVKDSGGQDEKSG